MENQSKDELILYAIEMIKRCRCTYVVPFDNNIAEIIMSMSFCTRDPFEPLKYEP